MPKKKRNLKLLVIQEEPFGLSTSSSPVQYAYFLDEDTEEVIKKEVKSESTEQV